MAVRKKKAKTKRKTAKRRVTKKRAPARRKKTTARKKTAARKKKTARRASSSRHVVAALDKAGRVNYFNGAAYGPRSVAVEFGSEKIATRMAEQLKRTPFAGMTAIGVFPSTLSTEGIRQEFSKKH